MALEKHLVGREGVVFFKDAPLPGHLCPQPSAEKKSGKKPNGIAFVIRPDSIELFPPQKKTAKDAFQ
jgi:hypothetical protein